MTIGISSVGLQIIKICFQKRITNINVISA